MEIVEAKRGIIMERTQMMMVVMVPFYESNGATNDMSDDEHYEMLHKTCQSTLG